MKNILKEIKTQPKEIQERLAKNWRFKKLKREFDDIVESIKENESKIFEILNNETVFLKIKDSSKVVKKLSDDVSTISETHLFVLKSDYSNYSKFKESKWAARAETIKTNDRKINNFKINESRLYDLKEETKGWSNEEPTVINNDAWELAILNRDNILEVSNLNNDILNLKEKAKNMSINLFNIIKRTREKNLKV